MDDEIENLVKQTKLIAEENNKILKGIRRSNRVSSFFRFIYWIIIIVATVGLYTYIQPYLDSISKLYGEVQTTNSKITNVQNSFGSGIKDFFFGSATTTKK